jgi:hypothetical protein
MSAPLFDPQHFRTHKTVAEWAIAGPTSNWWTNAVAAAIRFGESRALLRGGNLLVLRYPGEGPLVVEERPR